MKPAQDAGGRLTGQLVTEQLLHAFVPNGADTTADDSTGGNPCLLMILPDAHAAPAAAAETATLCRSWASRAPDEPFITVQCFTPDGRVIDCCGHGLLAAGHTWLQRLRCEAVSLVMNGSRVLCWQRERITWLQFQRINTSPCPVPSWLEEVFPNQPQAVAAAVCGDEKGYLVVQWPDNFDIKRLALPDNCLSNRSQRAIICTAAQPSTGTDAITLRYFAPQYGVTEDTATGSAMRVLADYWSPRFTQLTAMQCSTRGGQLLAKLAPDHVEIGGRVVTIKEKANND